MNPTFSHSHSPSRILMTADASEGVWSYVMELARALRPSGTDILLAVMGPELSPVQRAQATQFVHVGLCEKPFDLEWMEDPWHDVTRAGDWLLELEEQFEPHVIHLNHYCHGSLPWNAPVIISAHGCVLAWRQAVCGERSPHSSLARYHVEVSAGLRGANLVVAPTCSMIDFLTRLYTPAPRLLHFPNGARQPEFRAIPFGRDAARFRPTVKRDYVFSVGAPGDKALNLKMLDDVAQGLAWPIVLGCKGPLADIHSVALPHLHALHDLDADAMTFAQCQASIFAHPAKYDPFGSAPMEAALAGCALVLGDIPSLRETWGDAALFAPADDGDAFAAVLHGLVDDADLRREMAGRARARAMELTPERMAASILECYRELTHRPAAPVKMGMR
jgi:glycogen(starch) synthase